MSHNATMTKPHRDTIVAGRVERLRTPRDVPEVEATLAATWREEAQKVPTFLSSALYGN